MERLHHSLLLLAHLLHRQRLRHKNRRTLAQRRVLVQLWIGALVKEEHLIRIVQAVFGCDARAGLAFLTRMLKRARDDFTTILRRRPCAVALLALCRLRIVVVVLVLPLLRGERADAHKAHTLVEGDRAVCRLRHDITVRRVGRL